MWRHEQKFWISLYQYHRLRSAFREVFCILTNTVMSRGLQHSLYLWTPTKESAFDKLSGLSTRRKFSHMHLQSFFRPNCHGDQNRFQDRISKQSSSLNLEQSLELIEGELPPVKTDDNVLMQFYHEVNQKLIKPVVFG